MQHSVFKMYPKAIFIILFLFGIGSCKKFIEVSAPDTQLISSDVYASDASATAVMTGIYSRMIESPGFASLNTSLYAGLSADEFLNESPSSQQAEFYSNNLNPGNSMVKGIWGEVYQYIYTVNALFEGLQNSTGVSSATKNQLIGEGHFLRAFCYFYLINFFGDVPLVTSSLYSNNTLLGRTSKDSVYNQILADLKDAQNRLTPDYSFSNGEKVRPNQFAATALLARTYCYLKDWNNAQTEATTLINQSMLGLNANLDSVFLANNTEAIWQLKPNAAANTWEGGSFIILSAPNLISLNPSLSSAFEQGDLRRMHWVDSIIISGQVYYYPFKYKIQTSQTDFTEYSVVFRLAEQYLIRAEARLNLNDLPGAISDLNIIRNRAALSNTTANDPSSVSFAIEQERRIELFSEWGHRWFDLLRTGRAVQVLGPVKPGYQDTDGFYPIPQTELQNDPNLSQNPGY